MGIYFIYLAFITFEWFFISHAAVKGVTFEEKVQIRHKYFLIIACIELIILVGIRGYSVGADTSVYLSALDYYKSLPKSEVLFAKLIYPYDFELGYFLLTKVCAFLCFSKTLFLFLIAMLIYIPVFVAIYKRSLNPYISILTYFAIGLFTYSLGIFRQMIAMSIVLCGIDYIKERKFLKYLLLVVLAMTFHSTAILSLAIYFLYPLKWKINAIVFPLTSIAALLIGNYVVNVMIILMPKYRGYITGELLSGGSYMMLLLFLAIFLVLCWENFKEPPSGDTKLMFDALTVAILVQSLGYSLNIFGRAIGFFSVYLIFIIPNYLESFRGRWRVFVKIGVVLCLLALIFHDFNGNLHYIEYTTFLG